VSVTYIPVALRRLVEDRARGRCEYCLLPAEVAFFAHEVDHVIAEKHGGVTEDANLAYTCWRCNRHKGTDLGSFDPETGAFSMLFNPRTQLWREHFALDGDGQLRGLTPAGRTTVWLLQINTTERVHERRRLVALGRYPIPGDAPT
jgi:hypothetical protein